MTRALTGREKNMIIAALTIVFCALFTVYLIVPVWGGYMAVKGQLDKTTAGLAKSSQPGGAPGSANQDIEAVNSELNELHKQLPAGPNTAELLFYLTKAAQKTGVVLVAFETTTPQAKLLSRSIEGNNKKVYSTARVAGTYAQIRNFVVESEGLTRLTYNKSITVNEVSNGPGKLEGVIEIEAFTAQNDNNEFKDDSDVPKAVTGRPSPFRY
ncbi:MAG: type 4a pilus biogenesis protein PilO [Eubacteriales bacterium]